MGCYRATCRREDLIDTILPIAASNGGCLRRSLQIGGTAIFLAFLGPTTAYAEARIMPSTVDFEAQPRGVQSAPVVVELVNTGRNAFRVYRAEVNSGPENADLVIVNDGCTGVDLAPQARCPLEVAFKPTTVGPTFQTIGFDVSGLDYRTFGERAAVAEFRGVGTADGALPTTLPPLPGERTTAPVPLGLLVLVAGVGATGLGFFILASTSRPAVVRTSSTTAGRGH